MSGGKFIFMAYLLLASGAGAVAAPLSVERSPLPVHAVVLDDPTSSGSVPLGDRVEWLLSTGGYVLLADHVLEGRIGESRERLRSRCQDDLQCLKAAAVAAGIEQVVLVDRIDENTLGIRVLDVTGQDEYRRGTAALMAGWPDPSLVAELFQGMGSLRVTALPVEAEVLVDGKTRVAASQAFVADPLVAGKHALEFSAPGHGTVWMTTMIYPGQETHFALPLPVQMEQPRARPVGVWVAIAAALTIGGVAGLVVAGQDGGTAAMRR